MISRLSILARLLLIQSLILVSSCRHDGSKKDRISESQNQVKQASRFSLVKKDGYVELKIINPWQGATNISQVYYLVKRGSEIPADIDASSVIFVPLKSIICMSTTHVAMISAIGETNSITGVSGKDFIYSPSLRKNIDKGIVADVGYEANLNKEMILKLSPDLIMIYGIGSESSGYVGKIRELGVKVMINADYLETDPLARAEWIKLFGALYDKLETADSIFESESKEYSRITTFIHERIQNRPKVLLGLPFKETWYISPGNSFISKLISDAGGDYLWNDVKSDISMPYGIENVYLRALNAEYWLNTSTVSSKKEIFNVDHRLADLPCFKNGNLYNNNKRITEKGGNDFWENGSLHPHLILEDIASILHPGLFSGHELMYYRKIE